MNHEITQQIAVESSMFKLLEEGLRNTLAWKVQGNDFSRKLATLRFMAQSFHRHLEHLLAAEEFDGYMTHVEELAPQLARSVDALKNQHDKFRAGSRRILHGLERVSPSDQASFNKVCDEFLALLQAIDEHNEREASLFTEAFSRDGGGEG
jgi:hemerythrin-like domain-containing protein